MGVSAERGLSLAQARAAWAHYGDGGLPSSPEPSAWSLLAAQFKDFTVLALLGAAGVLACLGNFTDAAAIGAILAVNAALATTQELKAQRLLRALRQRSRPQVRVVRAGERRQIDPSQLVPGDILLLQAGEQVPADARLLEAVDLQTDESSLTGESLPVAKGSGAALQAGLPPGTPLAERINMVYAGSAVVRGRARALVVATGAHTEMGSVWKAVRQARQQYTPLQEQLLRLGHRLLRLSLLAGGVVFLLGVLRRQPLLLMVMTGLSMAVAAVPEGLPAIITVGLSMGVQRLVRRQAVVQHLGAVETLGRANLLCSDKTGTLTINRMKVRAVLPAQEILPPEPDRGQAQGTGPGAEDAGSGGNPPLPGFAAQTGARRLTTIIAALCNNAPADPDPTEQALVEHARQEGLDVERLRTLFSRRAEIPFDSMRSRMSVVVQLSPRPAQATTEQILLCKGAPDVIVGLSTSYWDGEAPRLLTDSQRQALLRYVDEVASQGLRVLAAGFRPLSGQGQSGESSAPGLSAALLLAGGGDPYGPAAGSDAQLEANLCLAGFVALADPPRPEARESLEHCHRNGVRVLMITGDQLPTSVAIARELRLAPGGADPEALLAPELDALDDDAALRRLQRVHVVARATPRHKLRIVRLMKRAGYILALTGDGANDAPALKAADVGIAMGRAGTDVSRAASSLVLADDNFSTIVHALEEGRLIRDNLNRSLGYLVSGNLGELLAVTGAVLLGWPAPLLPIHLLLVNLFTDALPAIALARTPPAEALQPPARVGVGDFQMTPRNWLRSALLGGTTLALYRSGMDASPAAAQSMALASLVGTQLLSALDWRAEGRPPLRRWLRKDAFFLAMLGGSAAGLAAVLHWPPLQRFFQTTPLSFSQWAGVGAAAAGSSLLARLAGRESLRPDRQVFKAHRGRRRRAPACANPRPPAHP
ncbi:MAG: cation-translocating P-type ATPase [Firmicutes bacterium]|nr:cation-translocating P-type ATPase [Bacillota bacterium]